MPRIVNPVALVEEFEEAVRAHAFKGTLENEFEREQTVQWYELRKRRLLEWIEDHR